MQIIFILKTGYREICTCNCIQRVFDSRTVSCNCQPSYLLFRVDAVVGLHYEGVLCQLEAVRGQRSHQMDLSTVIDLEEAGGWVDTRDPVHDFTLETKCQRSKVAPDGSR